MKTDDGNGATNPPPIRLGALGDLTRRVLGWMLLVSVIPLIVMAVQGYHCGMEAIVEKTNDHLLSLLSSRSAVVETWIDQRFSELDVVASSPSVARCCAHFHQLSEAEIDEEVTAMLRAMLRRVEVYDEIAVYGGEALAAGSPLAVVRRDPTKTPEEPELALQRAALSTDDYRVTEPFRAANGDIEVYIGRVFRNVVTGGKDGAIVAKINLTRGLDPLLQDRAGMGETGKVYVVDAAKGTIFTEPFAKQTPIALKERSRILEGNKSGALPTINDYGDYRGRVVLGGITAIRRTPWALVVEQDSYEATAWLRALIRRTLITGALLLVALVFLATWIARRLGSPLRELAHVAQRVRGGNVEERVPPLGGSEAEEVRHAFNAMLDELRAKQEELVHAATLASIGELSSSVVHEMRNPLSSIKLNIQGLRHDLANNPSGKELADIADAQVKRLEHMLDDLLQYGRPIRIQREPTPFADLARAAVDVLSEQARIRGVHISVEDELKGLPLRVDREQMCRALTNLLANAIQAADEGDDVRLRAYVETEASGLAVIEVVDSGSGLSPEAAERVFTPFFTTKTNGAGLGLANVKKIIELHGGTVSARNRSEGGAIFAVTIPIGAVA